MFRPVPSKIDFVQMEKDLLAWWDECGIVEKYLIRNDGSGKRFSFVDGPITANNPMGVHHAWGRTYKDLFQRYKTMQGFEQRYQNGFDGQGLWIEVNVEKDLGMTSKTDIEDYGVDKFVELCKERVRAVRGCPDAAVDPARILDGLGQLVSHDVGREQLHDLALPQGLPREGVHLRGARRDAVVPPVRHRHLSPRDRHRGLQGHHPPQPVRAVPSHRPARRGFPHLDDDTMDAHG